jgi:plasmid stabilization system protein ParE
VPKIVIAPRAHAQVAETIYYTLLQFGERKARAYEALIQIALEALSENAQAGKHRPEIHESAWTYHIARPGQRARHLFLYRIKESVEIARFLYDGMDLERHWPEDWQAAHRDPP